MVRRSPFSTGSAILGRDIHIQHHQQPYFHVCIDSPSLVFGVMGVSAGVLALCFGNQPIGETAIVAYWSMGLLYLWCHYLVHTKVRPRSAFFKTIRQNHMRHHCRCDGCCVRELAGCRDSRYWFSFTCPVVDEIFQTTPSSDRLKEGLQESEVVAQEG